MTFLDLKFVFISWFIVMGLAVGSFLNVVIFRVPRGFRLNLPSRSICIHCKRKLRWYENIPIASYLFLGGRCRTCKSPIALRYLLVETMTATLFVAMYRHFGFSFTTFYYCFFAAALVAITFIDLDFRIIPDVISIPGTAIGFLGSLWVDHLSLLAGWRDSLMGALLGGGAFWLLAKLYEKITSREGLGMGDVKLLAMIGTFLGPKGAVGTMLLSSLLGSIVGLILMKIERKNIKMALPFGPFLALGAMVFLFWGDFLLSMYYVDI